MAKVVVVGSINADLIVTTATLPLPGATVIGNSVATLPGGKGLNQAVAAARSGAATSLAGCLGLDDHGDEIAKFLAAEHIDIAHLARVRSNTGIAIVTVDRNGENTIVVVPGANQAVELQGIGDNVLASLDPGDVLLAQLELPANIVTRVLAHAAQRGAITMLNPSPVSDDARSVADHASIVVVNEVEADHLGYPDGRTEGQAVVITRGAAGVAWFDGAGELTIGARPANAIDTTGAGDCFTGVLAASIAQGLAIPVALRRAVVAASLQVENVGAAPAMPTAAEIETANERPPGG